MNATFDFGADYLLPLQGILGYVAVVQFLAWRSRPDTYIYRWTALWCLVALAFVIGRMVQLRAHVPEQAVLGSRITEACGALMATVSVVTLRAAGVPLRPARLIPLCVVLGPVFALIALLTGFIDSPTTTLRVDMLGRHYLEPGTGPLQVVMLAWIALVAAWLIVSARRSSAGSSEHRRALRRLALFIAPLVVNELLHAAQVITTFHAIELGLTAAAIALNNAVTQRYQRIEREQLALRTRFAFDVLDAQEDERRRIARELHDEASQSLTSVLVGLAELDLTEDKSERLLRSQALQRITQSTLDDLGRLARGLHPQLLDDLGFTAAVERYAAEIGRLHGIQVDVECVGLPRNLTPRSTATAMYRVVQEALTNAVRHGKARNVSLVMQRDGSALQVTVEDDGCGFDPQATEPTSLHGGLGLHAMRERVALLRGTVEVDSAPGEGTTLFARVPVGFGDLND